MFGGSPNTITGAEQAKTWKDMLGKLDAYQHIISGVIPFLPQPGPEVKFPEKVDAHANVSVVLMRPGTKGGEELRNGGRYLAEFTRTEKGWRISGLKADLVWYSGNMAVLEGI
ncbi:hypothetical protein CJF32_00006116 [Rutstroemia sp. NJR-2017a WRK4]|nr:hypothetical protein CJF32_00006116 [Rutstroemia sp. NJR-2017a WRK4]